MQVLDAFKNAPHFAGRATQIARVYRALHLVRAEVSVSGIANYGPERSAYCDAFAGCATGGVVPGGTAGAAILFGRGPGIVGELTFGPQSWSSRTAPSYQEEVALRRASAAILFRYGPLRPGRFSMAMLAGISQTVGDARGQYGSQRVSGPSVADMRSLNRPPKRALPWGSILPKPRGEESASWFLFV